MSLFQIANITLHSGAQSNWKIECDALRDEDLAALALIASERLPRFGEVIGIPRGGWRIAEALLPYRTVGRTLIVDDVLTTGRSMEDIRARVPGAFGMVLFSRGPCPEWITPLFRMHVSELPVLKDDGGGFMRAQLDAIFKGGCPTVKII